MILFFVFFIYQNMPNICMMMMHKQVQNKMHSETKMNFKPFRTNNLHNKKWFQNLDFKKRIRTEDLWTKSPLFLIWLVLRW